MTQWLTVPARPSIPPSLREDTVAGFEVFKIFLALGKGGSQALFRTLRVSRGSTAVGFGRDLGTQLQIQYRQVGI